MKRLASFRQQHAPSNPSRRRQPTPTNLPQIDHALEVMQLAARGRRALAPAIAAGGKSCGHRQVP